MIIFSKKSLKEFLPPKLRKAAGSILHPNRTIAATKCSLPHFIIIGAMKAGTTSLYSYLIQHPQILPSNKKEIHYFDANYEMGTLWYRSHFPHQSKIKEGIITGEASPYYLFHPFAPKRIFQLLPDVKLIIILRNPVDRAISHYFHEVRAKTEDMPIEKAIAIEEKRIEPDLKKMQANEYYYGKIYQRHSYKKRGVYIDQLLNYMNYFSKEQVLILSSEDFFESPREILKEVFGFLNVNPAFIHSDLAPKNVGTYEDTISPSLRQYLISYFIPHNQRLYKYLRKDCGW